MRTVEVLQRFALYVHPFGEDCLSFHDRVKAVGLSELCTIYFNV
jgi:hypothetical protein